MKTTTMTTSTTQMTGQIESLRVESVGETVSGRRAARVDQAAARSEQAVASYQRSVETAFREVADALVNVERSTGSEAELQLRLQAARSALDLSNERYRSGYSPFLEVLDAQRTVNDAAIPRWVTGIPA